MLIANGNQQCCSYVEEEDCQKEIPQSEEIEECPGCSCSLSISQTEKERDLPSYYHNDIF